MPEGRKGSINMVYEKVSPDMKFVEREKEVEKFWRIMTFSGKV